MSGMRYGETSAGDWTGAPRRVVRPARRVIAVALCLAAAVFAPPASAGMETAAKQALIVDVETGTVLLEKDSATPTPPASLSKLMTLYLVFERLKAGKLSLDDEFVVSRKAWRKGGSKSLNHKCKL